jgi:peptidoglycan/LPS O-acetylase OafA/YrhL
MDDEQAPVCRPGRPRRRTVVIGVAVSVVLGGVGIWWYADAPGPAAYNGGSLLVLPLVVIALIALHKILPTWLEWTGAVAIALVGPVGYLIFGGSQWWNWGQYTPFPLILLIASRTGMVDPDRADRSEPWYGGPIDGPWGPP